MVPYDQPEAALVSVFTPILDAGATSVSRICYHFHFLTPLFLYRT